MCIYDWDDKRTDLDCQAQFLDWQQMTVGLVDNAGLLRMTFNGYE
jgi:hypothetical protein